MDTEDVSNKGSGNAKIPAELQELDREFEELAEEFGLDESIDHDEVSELDTAIANTEFASSASASGGEVTLLDIADGALPESMGESEAEFFNPVKNWIKKRARKLIRKLIRLVRRYKKYASCIPAVIRAVAAYRAGKWGTALSASYSAYRCIRSKR